MKQIILSYILVLIAIQSSFAQEKKTVIKSDKPFNISAKKTYNIRLYLDSIGKVNCPFDRVSSTKPYVITSDSEIYYYDRGIFKQEPKWEMTSNLMPGNDIVVLTFQVKKGIRFQSTDRYLKSDNPNAFDIQFLIKKHLRPILKESNDSIKANWSYKERRYARWFRLNDTIPYSVKESVPSYYLKLGEEEIQYSLINYKIFWCGDGIRNSSKGTRYNNGKYIEECDPNDPSKENWGTDGCDCKCKRVINIK
jgi:hypothetical protein